MLEFMYNIVYREWTFFELVVGIIDGRIVGVRVWSFFVWVYFGFVTFVFLSLALFFCEMGR